jgi:hypothetical protein
MSRRNVGIVLFVLGLVLMVVSLAADVLQIGVGLGFGWRQITGSAVGALGVAVGAWLVLKKAGRKSKG